MTTTVRVQNVQSIQDVTVYIDGFTVITGANNSGKALANGTLVATPAGWVFVEALSAGDIVLAGDGYPTRVVGVYPQGPRETCEVEFDDGRAVTVDLDHLWKVSIGVGRFHRGAEQRWDVMTTRDIWNRVGDTPTRLQRPAIPSPGPAQYNNRPVSLDPYLIGLLLGVGCFQQTPVRMSTTDSEILSEMRRALPQGVSLNPCGGCDYRLQTRRGQPNPVLVTVQELGLGGVKSYEKFIPPVYRWNDIETRVAVLQGLMDTGGSVNTKGIAEFYSSSHRLTHAVAEIVYSLGGVARVRSKVPTYTYKGERRQGREAFTVTIRLPNFPLFRLHRKLRKVGDLSRWVQPLMVAFKKGSVMDCTCIEVEHDSHLFQIQGHLVTHNTALIRAIRGVFTNAPAGPLVRHGTNYLTVEITFDEGTTIKWEKGWEKPGQKGATVNRYTLNGKPLSNVGRGCPPEVLALGVHSLKAGTDTLWPQIADQFRGVLFLVGSPGSATAEAIADVDRVGRLSTALKLAESERRSVNSTLRVRQKDEQTFVAELETYDGLDDVGSLVESLETKIAEVETLQEQIEEHATLYNRHNTAQENITYLSGVTEVCVPTQEDVDEAVELRVDVQYSRELQESLRRRQEEVNALEGVELVPLPTRETQTEATDLREDLRVCQELHLQTQRSRIQEQAAEEAVQVFEGMTLMDTTRTEKTKKALVYLRDLQKRLLAEAAEVLRLEGELAKIQDNAEGAIADVFGLLGDAGECPTCNTIMTGDHHHEETS